MWIGCPDIEGIFLSTIVDLETYWGYIYFLWQFGTKFDWNINQFVILGIKNKASIG